MAIDRPETNAGAPPLGAGQHRRNFLVPRGMAALPSGEESCDDAVALKRSKRIALFFGQIRPLKRPFGAVETRELNGYVAIFRPIMMTRRVTPALPVALRLRPCASLCPTCSTGIAPIGFWSVRKRWCCPFSAPMGRVCASSCSDACPLSATIFLTKMEDDPDPLLVAINGSLRFRCVQGSRPLDRLPPCLQRARKLSRPLQLPQSPRRSAAMSQTASCA